MVIKIIDKLGAFQKLPRVMPSDDMIYSALRKSKMVRPTKGILNAAKRERNKSAKQMDQLMKLIAVPLRIYKDGFPNKKHLHPYESALIELTIGSRYYDEVLKRVDVLRKNVLTVGKSYAAFCAKSLTKRDAEVRLIEGVKKVEEIFNYDAKSVNDLLQIAKTLRHMPVMDLESPTLCLVGAPNVGKSSLVRILSTGKPEVCNYPFTTTGILMGHISLNFKKLQVTDTPGLLMRRDKDRNNLEKLTLAVLSHLPTAVMYVHDLSGHCGMRPSDQFTIYKEIRSRFNGHLWLDVVSKCDLIQDSPLYHITDDNDPNNVELSRYLNAGPDGAIHVSVTNKWGLSEKPIDC